MSEYPWRLKPGDETLSLDIVFDHQDDGELVIAESVNREDAELIVTARNALAILLERGWTVRPTIKRNGVFLWGVFDGNDPAVMGEWLDPNTAVVETYKLLAARA